MTYYLASSDCQSNVGKQDKACDDDQNQSDAGREATTDSQM